MKYEAVICLFLIFSFNHLSQTFPYTETFDNTTAPVLPTGWISNGFTVSTSSPRSAPNCMYTSGNMTQKILVSPPFDFRNRLPDKLTFWERRSSTAINYRLEVTAVVSDTNPIVSLALFDTITSTSSYVRRTIDLSQYNLGGNDSVRFQWILLADSTNSTGVLRLDDITLTVAKQFDIGIASMSVVPALPSRTDSLTISVVVHNYAASVGSFSVEFYKDLNNDFSIQNDELFASVEYPGLSANDSVLISVVHPPLKPGQIQFIALAKLPSDEWNSNDTARTQVSVGSFQGDIVINEFLYSPTEEEDEWIELYNTTDDTINIRAWKISDSNINSKATLTSSDYFFPPHSYLVVCKDHGFFNLHPEARAIRVPFAALNNTTPDAIVLFDAYNRTIDSLYYHPSWGGKNGRSLERFDISLPSTVPSNWNTSDSTVGTAGYLNSTARKNYDIALTRFSCTTSQLSIQTELKVKNFGRTPINTFTVFFYQDFNNNSFGDSEEIIGQLNINFPILPLDSITLFHSLSTKQSGSCKIIATAILPSDERPTNNSLTRQIFLPYVDQDVVINEIHFAPPQGECEWMELYNRTGTLISLYGWSFADRPTPAGNRNTFRITDSTASIAPNSYVVIAADSIFFDTYPYLLTTHNVFILNRSSGFSFNNDSDAVTLYDPSGKTIDSIIYLSQWTTNKGTPLERIDTEKKALTQKNWRTSVFPTGTPCANNSTARRTTDLALSSAQSTISGNQLTLSLTTINEGRTTITSFRFRILLTHYCGVHDSLTIEYPLLTITQELLPGDSLQYSTTLQSLPSGESKLTIELMIDNDEQSHNNTHTLTVLIPTPAQTIVMNEIQFNSADGGCEWFELYNRSNTSVNLRHWTFADRPSTTGKRNIFSITTTNNFIEPGQYVIVAADSTFFSTYPSLIDSPTTVFILNASNGFSFNNDSDAVTLYDASGNVIDSIFYIASWFTTKNVPFERIDTELPAISQNNWLPSEVRLGTPGYRNTVARKNADLVLCTVNYPTILDDENIPFVLIIANNGRSVSSEVCIKIFQNDTIIYEVTLPTLLRPLDTLTIPLQIHFSNYGIHYLTLSIFEINDEQPANNSLTVVIQKPYPHQSVVINEIMFDPLSDHCEWFEIYNRSEYSVDLRQWKFTDAPTSGGNINSYRITDSVLILPPQQYLCIAADSSIFTAFDIQENVYVLYRSSGFSFGNDSDAVVLYDHTGATIDSVRYYRRWHHASISNTKGRSLERISTESLSNDPQNWSTSTDKRGGTPGQKNSYVHHLSDFSNGLSVSPNPFSPNHDGIDDFCMFRYQLPVVSAFITLRIFDVKGRLVRTVVENLFKAGSDVVLWDGYDDSQRRVRTGMYIALFEANDPSTKSSYSYKKVIVVATSL